jgi:alkanesulfonate monooxygenase SsuD/methylene tetrahydromethanopterin reductase-like flavin-dependent oxidoreductase (luciferase family)
MSVTNIMITVHELIDAVHVDAQTGEITLYFSDVETLEGFVEEVVELLEQCSD